MTLRPVAWPAFSTLTLLLALSCSSSDQDPGASGSGGSAPGGCSSGQVRCGDLCVDTASNAQNCGTCGVSCAVGEVCSLSDCKSNCDQGLDRCGASCTDLGSDPAHCGACETQCTSGGSCVSGVCQSGSGGAGAGGSSNTGGTAGTGTGGAGTGGTGTGTCTDVAPDAEYTCAEQAAWDKCGEPWMAEFCDLSCGRCTPGGTGGGSGSGGTGGSGGSGGSGGGSGGTGSSECGVDPVNPSATPQAKNLLCYLYSQYGNHVISGQQEMSWDNPAGDPAWINTQTGKYPAILGGDYLYPDGTTDRAKAWWNAGGITMIRYHMGLPGTADTYENSKANIPGDKAQFFSQVLQSGTSLNTSFKSKLDYAAAELEELQDANVPVLWAPFHEVQPDGWFWWSKGSGAQFVSLWQYMYDYFTTEKGLNNLVWLMPFSGTPTAAFHPPTAYTDIAGPDTYDANEPFSAMFTTTKNIVGTTRPIPLHETGTMPSPSAMFNGNAAPWVLFNTWCGYQNDPSKNSVQHVKDVYADAHTVTRDELPNLK